MGKRFDQYWENIWNVGVVVGSALAAYQLRQALLRRGLTPTSFALYASAARVGVEVVGLTAAYIIDGEDGVEAWMDASNTMFTNRTILGDLPVVGDVLQIFPNPLGLLEVLFDAGEMIGEATVDEFTNFLDRIPRPTWANPMDLF